MAAKRLTATMLALACWTAAASAADYRVDDYLPPCSSSKISACEEQKSIRRDWKKAFAGDYQGQRNVSFCLSTGCDGTMRTDLILGCAWRVVILASKSRLITSGDEANHQTYCSLKLTDGDRDNAMTAARDLFQKIYRKPLPDGVWVLKARPPIAPPADLGPLTEAGIRFNAEYRRIGFERPLAAGPIECASDKPRPACHMWIGRSMLATVGASEDGERFHDVRLVGGGDIINDDWINAVTTVIAMFEPGISGPEALKIIQALHAPLMAGKKDFSAAHDTGRTHFTLMSHPMFGAIALTAAPR
jgi:hypothetical protein